MNRLVKELVGPVVGFILCVSCREMTVVDTSTTPASGNDKLSAGFLAFYPFNKDANDYGPNAHHGTMKGNARLSAGKRDQALELDGAGDYVEVNRGLNLGDELTVSCWINPDVTNRSDAAIFAKYETNQFGPYDFYLSKDRSAVWISNGSGSHTAVRSTNSVEAGVWTHLTWTAKGKMLKFYINGQFDSQTPIPAMTTNNDIVTIGRQALLFTTSGDLEFKGKIDELRVYSRELSQDEITQLQAL